MNASSSASEGKVNIDRTSEGKVIFNFRIWQHHMKTEDTLIDVALSEHTDSCG